MTVALSDIVLLHDLLRPLRDLNDVPALCNYLESFYTLRKPVSSTINTLAGALYKVFCASPDPARQEMREACFGYLSFGGICSYGPVSLLSGFNPRPLHLFLHFFAVAIYGVGRLMLPFPSPKRMWLGFRLFLEGNPELTIRHSYASQNGSGSILGLWYDDEISIIWKGRLSNYKSTLGLLKSIDFSSNRLTGEIPVEITHLLGLISLNLAGNYLTGTISPEIGKLQSLQSLDLSRNQISGSIPPSLLKIYGLGYLNLSYNNLFGKILIGTQLQNYGASSFLGNPKLCGIPLEICNLEGTGQPNVSSDQEDSDNRQITQGFYISLGLGFVVGFCGLCGSLIFKRSWRYEYYNFLNASNDWLYVKYKIGTRISDNSHNTNSGKWNWQMVCERTKDSPAGARCSYSGEGKHQDNAKQKNGPVLTPGVPIC
ncbi:hypothetical protein ACLB2K_042001 [Fragaria x ananassa]